MASIGLWKSSCNLSVFCSTESRIFTVFVTPERRLSFKGGRVITAWAPSVLAQSRAVPGETGMRWREKSEKLRNGGRDPDRAVQHLYAFGAGACGHMWQLMCAHPHTKPAHWCRTNCIQLAVVDSPSVCCKKTIWTVWFETEVPKPHAASILIP